MKTSQRVNEQQLKAVKQWRTYTEDVQGHSSFCSLFVCEQVCGELVHGCKRQTRIIRTGFTQERETGIGQRSKGGVKNREEDI